MHLFILTRGIKHEVDRLINDLQAQYFPFKYNGQEINLQLSVRPIQLWELIMPEDQLPIVQNTLWQNEPVDFVKNIEFSRKLLLAGIRTSLGANIMPDLKKELGRRMIYNQNVAIYPIGIKQDDKIAVENEKI